MSGHLSESELEGYYRRQLPVDELLAVDEHLATCEVCYERFRGDDKLEELYSFARASIDEIEKPALECIVIERLTAFVNQDPLGNADREEIQAHLAVCEGCSELVSDLRSVRSEIDWTHALGPPEQSVATGRFATRPRRLWRPVTIRRAALAAMLLVTLAAGGLFQKQLSGLRTQIGELQQANEALQREAADSKELRDQVAELENEIDGLRLGPSAREEIALTDAGKQVVLDPDGKLSGLDSVSPNYTNLVKEALSSGLVRVVAASLPKTRPAHVRGGVEHETFKLRSPLGVAVLSERPTFRWEALQGAERYVVFVRDLAEDVEVEGESTAGLEWTPRQPLMRGHTYVWVVEAVKDGRRIHAPAAQLQGATFKVLEKTKADELALVKSSSGGSHLLMAVLYGKYGLVTEAESEIKLLRAENPESHTVARLLRSLRSKRH